MTSAPVSTPPIQPTRGGDQAGRGHPKGGGHARCYAFPSKPEAHRKVEKGCLTYLAFVQDSGVEVPSMNLVPLTRKYDDPYLLVLDTLQQGDAKKVVIRDDGVRRLQGRICLSNVDGLRELILEEAHSLRYSIHPGATRMYHDLKQYYKWRRMTKDIIGHVSWCLNYQQVKYEHHKPGALLQKVELPEWK
ncbi:uncharacterized protein [Nicotiana sylvestris]|uniref:uncharacterized protein n=1 Tax=Nicotiana sylvestris TaxID=4096 RepID=UPI00388C3956